MALLSVTRVKLRKLRFGPQFVAESLASAKQARHCEGFIGGYLAMNPPLAFWTVTVWRDEAAMHAYRGRGKHLSVMPRLKEWCDEAALASVLRDGDEVPDCAEAAAILRDHGRTGKLLHPSEAHLAGSTWPDGKVPNPGQSLKPPSPATRS